MNETLARQRDDLELLSIRKVAELLGVSRLSVNRLIERGLVPVYRILSCVRFNCTPAWRGDIYVNKKD